jgi:cell filamentation protein
MTNRYSAPGSQGEFEPGSRGRVLRNLQGVKSVREMAWRESDALVAATQQLIDATRRDQRFTESKICEFHKVWLGEIYPWAGEYRDLNVVKGAFMFAAAAQVPRLMAEFERGALREFTPCRFSNIDEQAQALAVVHAELVLIHPFRDGNGRCARLLAVLMGLQAGLPTLDFGGIHGNEKRRYIAAVQAGLDRNYNPMTLIFRRVIERTLRLQASG